MYKQQGLEDIDSFAEDDEEVVVDGQAGQQPVEDALHLRAGTQERLHSH